MNQRRNRLVTLRQMKNYLGIDGRHLDNQIRAFIGTGIETAEKALRFPLSKFEDGIPFVVNEAIKFVVASYYANREQTDAQAVERTVAVMLSALRQDNF